MFYEIPTMNISDSSSSLKDFNEFSFLFIESNFIRRNNISSTSPPFNAFQPTELNSNFLNQTSINITEDLFTRNNQVIPVTFLLK